MDTNNEDTGSDLSHKDKEQSSADEPLVNMIEDPEEVEAKENTLLEKAAGLQHKMQVADGNHCSDNNTCVVVADEVSLPPPPLVETVGVVVSQERLNGEILQEREEENARLRETMENQRRIRRKRIYQALVSAGVILVVGAIVTGIMCGIGQCKRRIVPDSRVREPLSTREIAYATLTQRELDDRVERLKVHFNNVTFSPNPIVFPLPQNGPTAEERALAWLIGQDDYFVDVKEPSLFFIANQRYALAALYFSVGVAALDSTWLSGDSGCNWTGVYCEWCSVVNCTSINKWEEAISSLFIQDKGLSGELPSDIALLGDVQLLYFGNNRLSGAVPSSIGTLVALQALWLSNNERLLGLPTELAQLSTLQVLEFSGNYILGSGLPSNGAALPSFLFELTSLTWLGFNRCSLEGTIPPEINQLSSLRILSLTSNRLSGTIPPGLFDALTNLEYLELSDNGLNGTIPNGVGNLSQLNRIDLSENLLTGALPSRLWNLTKLDYFSAGSNILTGLIPRDLVSLPSITVIFLSDNLLTGRIPTPRSASNVTELHLNTNKLSGTIPIGLSSLTQLTVLDLSSNELTGTLPSSLSTLSNIKVLFLLFNQLSGEIHRGLVLAWKDISVLDLSQNNFSGTIASELGILTKLEGLRMDYNQFSGTIPTQLSRLTKLGTIDFLLAQHLTIPFSLNNNNLWGTIPTEFGESLSNLKLISLNYNQLTGTIPSELGLMSELTSLFLGSNRLEGTIPTELQRLKRLETLSLGPNLLEGTIPSDIGDLTRIREFSVRNNSLTGEVPLSVSKWTDLTLAYFFNNLLQGEMPLCEMELSGMAKLVADCGDIDCPCCTACCPAGQGDIPMHDKCGEDFPVTEEEITSSGSPESSRTPPPSPRLIPIPPAFAVITPVN